MDELKNKIDELDIYGDQVKEALSNPPSSLYTIGNWVVLLFLFIILFLTWIIKFPDIISADIEVVSKSKPVKIISEGEGILSNLFITNKDYVQTNDPLAVISSIVKFDDIILLQQFIDSFDINFNIKYKFPESLNIGDIKDNLNELENIYLEYHNYLIHMPERHEIDQIKNQILKLRILDANLKDQIELHEEQLSIYKADYERNKALLEDGVISSFDLENKRIKLIDIKKEYEIIKYNKASNLSSVANLKRELSKFDIDENMNISSYLSRIDNSLNRLNTEIDKWKRAHIKYAKQSGTISFFNHFEENQFISKGTPLFSISTKDDQFIGEGFLSLRNSGKVQIGQRVIIKLEAFPDKEFGNLQGQVLDISSVSDNEEYLLKIDIPEGLKTSYSIELPYKPSYKGKVDIVTEDLRLIERVFFEMRNIFKKYNAEQNLVKNDKEDGSVGHLDNFHDETLPFEETGNAIYSNGKTSTIKLSSSVNSSRREMFLIIAGSFSNLKNAEKMQSKLIGMNYSSEIIHLEKSATSTVIAARYNDYKEAFNTSIKLKNNGIDCYIIEKNKVPDVID